MASYMKTRKDGSREHTVTSSFEDLALIFAVGAGIWLVSKFVGIGKTALNTVTQPIANAYVSLTSPAAPQVQGMILMPDGSTLPVSSVSPSWIGNALVFSYQGTNYQLYGHDSNGNYPAAYYLG